MRQFYRERFRWPSVAAAVLLAWLTAGSVLRSEEEDEPLLFRWKTGPPLLAARNDGDDLYYAVKDPSVVRYGDRWHLFCTVRGQARSHQIEYIAFDDFPSLGNLRREFLAVTDGYYCAPQIFFFRPHGRWYLIYQTADPARKPSLQPAYSTTQHLNDPSSWSPPRLLFDEHPENVTMWIDFWVICDDDHAHLFFTSLDGRMWRAQTPLADFPHGWSRPEVALRAGIFEASHTYRLAGRDEYLTIVEAQGEQQSVTDGSRFYKAYVANRLDGPWRPLADSRQRPFAASGNVDFTGPTWAASISHGELLRKGYDQRLEVDPNDLRMLFQGATNAQMQGRPYGQIPWQLGLLVP